MAHVKNLANRAYISTNLKEKLNRFEINRYNFICAPTGFGKSMVSRTFFKNFPGYTVLWVDGNTSKKMFWNNLCNAIKMLSPSYAQQFQNIGFPESEEAANSLISLLAIMSNERSMAIIVIDNFDCICNEYILKILSSAYASTVTGFKYIFIMKEIHNQNILSMISKGNAGLVSKKDLSFNQEDIYDYFRLNEVIIDKDTSKDIYNYSYGWPYIIQLFLNNYKNATKIDVADSANQFIDNNVWVYLDDELKNFLVNISVFDSFTLKQCVKQTMLPENICLEYLNAVNLIDYDEHSRTFTFNPIFGKYLLRILSEYPKKEIKDITLRAADTYLANANYFSAIKLYCDAKEYEKIYLCDADLNSLYNYITKENKDIFTDIANHYWDIDKKGNYNFSIIISFAMLLYNEKSMAMSLLSDIESDIKEDNNISENYKVKYYSEIEYVKSYIEYNDIVKMNENFKKISSLTKAPVDLIAGKFPYNFECPSILSLYHRKCGALDVEMLTLEDVAPNYYRITNGHGKGYEALMRADVLYNRGEIDGAEILCHKAIYMADSRNQYSITVAANYLLALISVFNGSNDTYKEYMNSMNKIVDGPDCPAPYLEKMVDVCKAHIYSNQGEIDSIANWLKDEKSIEDHANFYSLSFVNIVLGKYLLLSEDYHHFLGISGQFLGLSKVFSHILPRIYTYIYLAIANHELGEVDKAKKFLVEAAELAVHDRIVMPFVHNYSMLEEMLNDLSVNKNLSSFVKNIQKLSKNYDKGIKTIKKAGRILANYGLTVREADVAKLAAQRLSNKEIAEQLFIAESTVKSNMKVIFNKLHINSRSELKNFFE